MSIKEESLKKALEASHCLDLPRQMQNDEERFWIEAVILVKKQNMTQSYAIATHRGDGSINYTADFGAISPIAGIVSIHPYLYLDNSFIPEGDTESLRHKMMNFYYSNPAKRTRIENASAQDIEFMKIEYAIDIQKNADYKTSMQEEMNRIANEIESASKPFNSDDEEPEILVSAKRKRKTTKRNG